MKLEFGENFNADLYGLSTVVHNGEWGKEGVQIMNKMWEQVKSRHLGNKGINIWVYEQGNRLFTGVELTAPPPPDAGLEAKQVRIARYVKYKHIGPYEKIRESCEKLAAEFQSKGIKAVWPYVEVYGHWSPDPSKLETDLLWTLG
ncbi:MAG: GyrI-like domain-containing protein [Bacteroidota bacterium]|nr:GyrI-like domain-containing protein [Bacteroidota bacterium]MDP4245254.1 GyrI-like domain-containing protein [Bacteroidota bacterium]MDP4255874.1 GyrI-like domain-containing protein [Bacteroidota bacterium]MDP4260290.1 GyrI-like domain-containing protein [Bacteroidota bacterium]